MNTIESLTKPVTRDEAKESIYNVLATVGVNTTSWKPGAVIRTLIAAVAVLFAASTRLIAEIAKGGFLELASGEWLTLLARYVYGVERLTATFATARLYVVNYGGGIYDLDPGDLVVRNAVTGAAFTNVSAVRLDAGIDTTLGVITIDIVALEAGSASTSVVGAITSVVTGVGATVTVSNTTTAVGIDDEDDDTLKQRCRDSLGSRSVNGPADAYGFVVRGAKRADGSAIGINRIRITKDGKGGVHVTLATPNGDVADGDLDVVRQELQSKVVPEGVTAYCQSAKPLVINVAYRVWLSSKSSLSDADLNAKIVTAVAKRLANVPIGGYRSDGYPEPDDGIMNRVNIQGIHLAICSVEPKIIRAQLLSPAADMWANIDQAPRLGTCDAVSIAVAQQETMFAH